MSENNWAITVGINQYEYLPSDDHLKYAVSDAIKVRQFLCEQAQFSQDNVLLCCDGAPEVSPMQRPNRNGLRDLLLNKIQRAKQAHNFWFFYAGHGIVHDHQDFLLPCDGNPKDLKETAIPISFVTDCLRDCDAHNVVLVLDMCRNYTRSADEGSRGIGEEMGEQTLEIAREQGIVTLFSCSRGQRSYEIAELQQGAFTYVLLEGLKQSTTPRALEKYLAARLPALNRQYGKDNQVPMVIPEPGSKYDLPLLLSCATSADIQQLKDQAKDAELENEDYERAKRLWRQVIIAAQSTSSAREEPERALKRIDGKKQKREAEERQKAEQEKLRQEAEQQRRAEEHEKQRLAQEAAEQQAERERLQREQQRREEEQKKQNELASEKGVDYTRLRDLLKAKHWQKADKETTRRMYEVTGGRKEGWLRFEDIKQFPCADLRTIDQLWVKYSEGKFGFSVQKKIWQSCDSPTAYNEQWGRFRVKVGWLIETIYDTRAVEGHLPVDCVIVRVSSGPWFMNVHIFSSLAQRLVKCNIQ